MKLLKVGDKIGIVCCSNGQRRDYREKIKRLESTLVEIGLEPVFSKFIYEKDGVFSGTTKERAEALLDMYKDDEIRGIFDISGGDVANGILPYLDYDVISKSDKMFWGYSDLTTVINALYTKANKKSVLYQIRNLIYDRREEQINNFKNTVLSNKNDLFDLEYKFVQGSEMQGIVIGGNIRCFLKIAGTEYMPNFDDKILLLESYGGSVAQMDTYLNQLQQLGAFDKINGVLLGTFTQMESENIVPTMEMIIKEYVRSDTPIAVTRNIGHGTDSKGIIIGQEIFLEV